MKDATNHDPEPFGTSALRLSRFLLACIVATSILTAASPIALSDGSERPSGIPADWQQITSNIGSDNFHFWAPRDVKQERRIFGIDELVKRYESSDLAIGILCCGYRTSPVQPPSAPHQDIHEKVGGKAGRLFIYQDKQNHPDLPFVADLYIPNAGGKVHFRAVRFNMTIWCRSEAEIGTAKQIISSLKFIKMSIAK